MAATLHRLRTKRQRLREEQAAALRQMILDFEGLPDHAAGAIIAAIDRETAAENGWTFVMLSPAQNRAVITWLLEHSEPAAKAVALWVAPVRAPRPPHRHDPAHARRDRRAGRRAPDNVSEIMADLESIGAISRRRERVPACAAPAWSGTS